jgi:hypothetical protein
VQRRGGRQVVLMFSSGPRVTLGLAPVQAKIAERVGAALQMAKVAGRAAAVLQPAEEPAVESCLLEAEAAPDSVGVVGLRAERAPVEQTFSPGREESCRAVARPAWPPADPAFCLFRPARTLLSLRRLPVTRAHS